MKRVALLTMFFVMVCGLAMGITPERAHEIMGKNFFGVDEAEKYFGVPLLVYPSEADSNGMCSVKKGAKYVEGWNAQITVFWQIPFSEQTLEECKDTHILVAVFPMSILEVRAKAPKGLFGNSWWKNQYFAGEAIEAGWYLIRKTPVECSLGEEWSIQLEFINENEEVPSAQVMVYSIIGHYLATGEKLFSDVRVRTRNTDNDGLMIDDKWSMQMRMDVGCFQNNLDIHASPSAWNKAEVGLASARKSEQK